MRPVLSVIRSHPIGSGVVALFAAAWLIAAATMAAGAPANSVCDGQAKWDNWSWGSVTKVDGSRYYDKKPTLGVRFTEDWAGLSFATNSFDTSEYKDLRFMVHHNGGPIPALQVGLHDRDGKMIKYVPAIDYGKMGDNGWLYVSIPLNELGAEKKKVTRVTLQQRHQSTSQFFNIAGLGFGNDGKKVKKEICLVDGKVDKKDDRKVIDRKDDKKTDEKSRADGKDEKKDDKKVNFISDKDRKKDGKIECPLNVATDLDGHTETNAGEASLKAYVFDGKLYWSDRSWDTKACVRSDGPRYNGDKFLNVKYTAPWAGLSFRTDGFVSGYNNLEFAMHANGGPIPSLRAIVYDGSGEIGRVRVANYITGMNGSWYEVAIPLEDLGAEGKEVVRVTLQEGRGIVPPSFLVDDLRFTWP